MKVYVGVTDSYWFEFLASRSDITEANFWRPGGGSNFRALHIGEPFLFKTRYPENLIVGGGFFSGFTFLSIREAWEFYGEENGAPDASTMLRSIASYRKDETDDSSRIGCVLLRDMFFLPREDRIPAPADFSRNLVQGRTYDLDELSPEHEVHRALFSLSAPGVFTRVSDSVDGPVFGLPTSAKNRLGQRAFRAMVTTGYGRRCAVTGERIRPTLQAAHIRPVEHGGENRLDNGLLLRSDVHTLFDRGYLGLDGRNSLRVSRRLRAEFSNGEEFYRRAGEEILLPTDRRNRPAREFVEWHNDVVFLD